MISLAAFCESCQKIQVQNSINWLIDVKQADRYNNGSLLYSLQIINSKTDKMTAVCEQKTEV